MLVFLTVPICAQVTLHVYLVRYGWITLRVLGLHQYYIASVTTQFVPLRYRMDSQYERIGMDYGHRVRCCRCGCG